MARRLVIPLALTAMALLSATATAATLAPPGQVLTGVSGGTSAQPYAGQVRRAPGVFGVFVRWGSLGGYVFDSADRAGARLMIHVSTQDGYGTRQVITPRGISLGSGDGYLLQMNRRIAQYGKPTYIRFLAEMNQVNNGYSAFNRDGSSRGRSHSTAAFRQAWRRAALILRGGPVAAIGARLRKLGLPGVKGAAAGEVLPRPAIAMAWVPQTRGTPDIPANMPIRYWPGAKYVDWVGTDFYSRFPRFDWLTDFYNRFRGKPFVFAEWALWGADDPGFVRRLFSWINARKRVKMILYNQGKLTDGPFRLNRYPRARAELRRQLSRSRFR